MAYVGLFKSSKKKRMFTYYC